LRCERKPAHAGILGTHIAQLLGLAEGDHQWNAHTHRLNGKDEEGNWDRWLV